MQFTLINQKFAELQCDTAIFLESDSRFIDHLCLKETENCLITLSSILSENKAAELAAFLAARWQRVVGSCLDYVSSPERGITQLCLLIAQWLHHNNNSKKIYQYLMPTLTCIEDTWPMFTDEDNIDGNIDSFPLSQLILSDNYDALIPVTLLTKLQIDVESEQYLWYHRYNNPGDKSKRKLSEREITALFNHSILSTAMKTHIDRIRQCMLKSPTVGGEIARLAKGLLDGSVLGKGTELRAAPEAMEAIANFMSYWHGLDKEGKVQETFYFLQAEKGTPYLGDLIALLNLHIYIKRDAQGNFFEEKKLLPEDDLLCAKTNYGKLQAILAANPSLFDQSPESAGLLDNLKNQFENLKKQLPEATGNQKNPLTLASLSCIEEVLTPYRETDDLITLFKQLDNEASMVLCQMIDFLTKEKLVKKNSHGKTLLHWAVKNGRLEIVNAILAVNADTDFLNAKTKDGYTAGMLAVSYGHTDCLKAIFEKNDSLDLLKIKNDSGNTVLMLAAYNGYIDCLKAILEKDSSLDLLKIQNGEGHTALTLAAKFGYTDCLKAILDKNDSLDLLKIQDNNGNIALTWAVENKHKDCFKAMLEKNSSLDLLKIQNKYGHTVLSCAARHGDIDSLKAILEKNSSLDLLKIQDKGGYTALMLAVINFQTSCFKAILEKNDSLDLLKIQNNRGTTVLLLVAKNSEISCLEAILKKFESLSCRKERLTDYLGVDSLVTMFSEFNGKNNSVLCQMIRLLTKEELVQKNGNGETVLHWAVGNNHLEIVNAILAINADINFLNIKTKAGYTALMLAACHDHIDCLRAILEKNDSIDLLKMQDNAGNTALMVAILYRSLHSLKAILTENGSLDLLKIQNIHGDTALILAAKDNQMDCLKAILEKNTYSKIVMMENYKGKTAINYVVPSSDISEELASIFDNPFLLVLKIISAKSSSPCTFWADNLSALINEFVNVYQVLYKAYETTGLKQALDTFVPINEYLILMKVMLSPLNEEKLRLYFKRLIDDIKYVQREPDLPVKIKSMISCLTAGQADPGVHQNLSISHGLQ